MVGDMLHAMWKLFIGGVLIGRSLNRAGVEEMTETFDAIIRSGGGWHDIQFPMGDGIGTHRVYLNAATHVLFLQETL